MMMSAEGFAQVEPILIRRENGGWLAVTQAGTPITMGVVGWSAEDARSAFVRAAREWAWLQNEPAENRYRAVIDT